MKNQRLLSLDLFRGLTMFLLVAEGTGLYEALKDVAGNGTIGAAIIQQFFHHDWNGLHFWDLIQPFFMFIVGVAMVFSLERRWESGATWGQTFKHIFIRCVTLLFLGVFLQCGYSGKLVWELWNVLAQLSFTILVAFLIFKLPWKTQVLISFGLLALSEFFYRIFWVAGYNQPFVPDHNFGSFMDMVLMGHLSGGHWIAINALPTAAHTIWGVLAGKLLRSTRPELGKIKILAIAGAIGLVVGYGLDWTGITPIIKRICTTSFIFASGGWCLLTLAFFYWLVDVRKMQKGVLFFAIVGMNPIFIYLFAQTVGGQWFNGFVAIFSGGLFMWLGMPEHIVAVLNALAVLAAEWYLCYWLYKKQIVFKI
jgi:predicted acyltransferase